MLAHAARLGHSPWGWHPHPDVWALVIIIAGAYAWALRPSARSPERPVERRQVVCLVAGVLLLWLASDWPVHDVAEGFMYSIHMVQHIVFTLVVPPLLLLGTPSWVLRRVLRPVMPVFRQLVRPAPAILLFNVTIAATHWTGLTNLAVRSGPAHLAQHVALVVTAFLMWWPVVGRLPEETGRMHPGVKMFYLFLQSLIPTVPASFLTFGDHPLYHSYERFPKLFGMTAAEDQQAAGALMKVGGGLILWAVILVVFLRWFQREGGPDRPGGDPAVGRPPAAAVSRYVVVANGVAPHEVLSGASSVAARERPGVEGPIRTELATPTDHEAPV